MLDWLDRRTIPFTNLIIAATCPMLAAETKSGEVAAETPYEAESSQTTYVME